MKLSENKSFQAVLISGIIYIILRLIFNVTMDVESVLYYAGLTILAALIISRFKKITIKEVALTGGLISLAYILIGVYMKAFSFDILQLVSIIEQSIISLVTAYVVGVKTK